MNDKTLIFLLAAALILNIVANVAVWFSPETTSEYRLGQIDAINGKIQFELIKKDDGTTEWKRKEQK